MPIILDIRFEHFRAVIILRLRIGLVEIGYAADAKVRPRVPGGYWRRVTEIQEALRLGAVLLVLLLCGKIEAGIDVMGPQILAIWSRYV